MKSSRPPPGGSGRPPASKGRTGRPSRASARPPRSTLPSTQKRSRRPGSSPPAAKAFITPLRWAIFGVALLVGLYLGLVTGYGSSAGPGTGREVDLDWPAGMGAEEAAQRLDAAGLVMHPRLFAWFLKVTGATDRLRPGRHLLTDDLSPRAIVRRMQRSDTQEHAKIVVPEGFTRFDIARRLQSARICSAKGFLDATVDAALLAQLEIPGDSAEGFLFPATYELSLDSDAGQVVSRMKAELDKRFARITRDNPTGTDMLDRSMHWSIQEILTLASVVEKEAAVDDERPLIASVFLNRLRDPTFSPKRLQSDPTSVYGCLAMPERIPSCRTFNGRPTPDLNADDANPYTTYRHEGLPPGPICSPGEKSIEAVLVPAESRYFYFVARGEGRHTFSETYAQHNEAIHRLHASQP